MPRSIPLPDSTLPVDNPQRVVRGIYIPIEIWNADLPHSAKMLYGELYALDGERGCYASNKYLAKFMQLDTSSIGRLIALLKDAGFIQVEIFTTQGNKRIISTKGRYPQKQVYPILKNKDRVSSKISIGVPPKTSMNMPETLDEDDPAVGASVNSVRGNSLDPNKRAANFYLKHAAQLRATSREQSSPEFPKIHATIKYFKIKAKEITGDAPVPEPGKDRGIVRNALKHISDTEAKAVIDFFLTSDKAAWAREHQGIILSAALSAKMISLYRASKSNGHGRKNEYSMVPKLRLGGN